MSLRRLIAMQSFCRSGASKALTLVRVLNAIGSVTKKATVQASRSHDIEVVDEKQPVARQDWQPVRLELWQSWPHVTWNTQEMW